jgi:hypothetical protein
MAPVRPVLHRFSCSNETVLNAPKHEFLVKWSGSGAFVAKNSDATLFSELVRSWHLFGQFASTFVSNETVRNASKHEFLVQCSGSRSFVAKKFEASSFSEFVP